VKYLIKFGTFTNLRNNDKYALSTYAIATIDCVQQQQHLIEKQEPLLKMISIIDQLSIIINQSFISINCYSIYTVVEATVLFK